VVEPLHPPRYRSPSHEGVARNGRHGSTGALVDVDVGHVDVGHVGDVTVIHAAQVEVARAIDGTVDLARPKGEPGGAMEPGVPDKDHQAGRVDRPAPAAPTSGNPYPGAIEDYPPAVVERRKAP